MKTKLYISEQDIPKINQETGKVDIKKAKDYGILGWTYEDNFVSASTVMVFPDDTPILVDVDKAFDIFEVHDHGNNYKVYFFSDGTEVELNG